MINKKNLFSLLFVAALGISTQGCKGSSTPARPVSTQEIEEAEPVDTDTNNNTVGLPDEKKLTPIKPTGPSPLVVFFGKVGSGIGTGASWFYKNALKPLWDNHLKPGGQYMIENYPLETGVAVVGVPTVIAASRFAYCKLKPCYPSGAIIIKEESITNATVATDYITKPEFLKKFYKNGNFLVNPSIFIKPSVADNAVKKDDLKSIDPKTAKVRSYTYEGQTYHCIEFSLGFFGPTQTYCPEYPYVIKLKSIDYTNPTDGQEYTRTGYYLTKVR